MKFYLGLLILGIASCNFFAVEDKTPFVTKDYLDQQKAKASFEVYDHDEHPFKGWSENDLKKLLGLSSLSLKDTSDVFDDYTVSDALPESFDSRTQWPDCIHPIRDQGKCGSCWAHAASEVLSDRFCIASNGAVNVVLSPEDMVSCDYLDRGCNGGILQLSWTYLVLRGIVTDECKPYTSGTGEVEKCSFFKSQCRVDGVEYKKYKAKKFYNLSSINAIKQSLYENGPVESGFRVYDDFMNYKSGIYKKNSDKLLGGHAVKIVGWGVENGTEYWIVANSWGVTWGENGFFRIAFGECGIENCISGDPKL